MLVAFCATLMPLPMISSRQSKESGEAFPCQNRPCGCRTAHQCWTNCCCTTPVERLAWAKSHGVTPPAYAHRVLHALASEAAEAADSSKTQKECCAKRSTCCVDKTKPAAEQVASPKSRQRHFVIGALALACQGKSSAFTSLPWAIVEVRALLQRYVLPTELRWQIEDLQPIAVTHIPPLPPPRIFFAT